MRVPVEQIQVSARPYISEKMTIGRLVPTAEHNREDVLPKVGT
jgi:hypothetical protein